MILQWIAATVAVVALIVILGQGARWLLGRARLGEGPARQRGVWRVAPDARVRAVEVLGTVHLVLERGSTSTALNSMDRLRFDALLEGRSTADPQAGTSPLARVAKG